MSGETQITVQGRLTADPELRFTQSGVPLTRFTVASSTRIFDRDTQQWKDGDKTFIRCNAWRGLAEAVAEKFHKGTPVIAVGHLVTREWPGQDGQPKSVLVCEVDDIGMSAKITAANTKKPEAESYTGSYDAGGSDPF